MKAKLKISGVGRLRKLFDDKRRSASSASVEVGYTAQYAIYVHEMVDASFKTPGTKAKFLEAPARELKSELANIIGETVDAGGTLEQGLLKAGLRLQRASQKIVPLDTGNLKSSAFTRKGS